MAGARSPDQGSHKKVLPAIPSEFRAEHAPFNGGRGSRARDRRASHNHDGESERGTTSQPVSPATPTTPASPSSQVNGGGISSPPSPPASHIEDETDVNHADSIPLPRARRKKALPIAPGHQLEMSASPESKRKAGYFAIGKSFTFPRLVTHARPKFAFNKKSKDRHTPSSHHTGETTHSLPTVLPVLAPSSPISHMLPTEYFPEDYNVDEDERSDAQTTPDLTIDDLYHLVLNMQKGFQVQMEEMSSQIKELKREIRRLKNEESDEEGDEEEEEDLEELMLRRSAAGTAASVRSTTRELDRHADTGRWFHNENL